MKTVSKNILISFCLIIILLSIQPISIYSNQNSEIFTRIGIEQGLAPGNVNDIIQDSLGFLWLATESGLCRYDGYKFLLFQNEPNDSSSLSYNNVFSLLKWNDGIIWVGTLGGGLNKFDTRTHKFTHYRYKENDVNSISNDIIFKVFSDSDGQIWISTLGGGLNHFDPQSEEFQRFTHDATDSNSISSNMVSAIFEKSNNNLLIGTFDAGLNLFDIREGKFTHFFSDKNRDYSINHNQVMDILSYSNDQLLVATFGGGVNLLNTKTMEFQNYQNSENFRFNTEHKNIRKLFDDGENIWIGTYNGLYKYEKPSEKIYKYSFIQDEPNSINNNKIREIFKDGSEIIWIGTTQGANLLDQNRKKFDYHAYSNSNQRILGTQNILEIPPKNKVIWPNNISQIKKYNEPVIFFHSNLQLLTDDNRNTFRNFYYDENNTLWVGDYNGLKYYDTYNNEFRYIEYFNNVNESGNDFVKSFYIDSKGDFWAGTLGGGLTHYDYEKGEVKKYIHLENDEKSISDSRVIPILEDSYGVLWIGTYGGLNKFNREKEEFIRYINQPNDNASISNNRIYSIHESNNGDLWIGTYQGLNKYIRETDNFEYITTNEGLLDNTIYAILEDELGRLWIRTNNGISEYDPLNGIIKNYTLSDGLIGVESNGNICFKNSDGRMIFGGLNGFNSFYPKDIKDNLTPPQVVFTELRVLDSLINVGDLNYLEKSLNDLNKLVLSYTDKVFSIEFAALHYAIPSKNKYAYMLEGFRDKWTFVDSDNRRVSFTNLNAGDYTLHVKASNNDGIWNETGRSLRIVINPPYWDTWWFQLSTIALFLLIIFLFYEYRLHRLLEVERTRARIARNLHDDVGGTLASIQYFVNAIRKNISEEHKDKFLDLIMASSNDAQEKIRDIIWTVNPKEDRLSRFLVKVNRYASDLLDSNGIEHSIKFPKVDSEKSISMEKRQHLWCICKETIINTVKHSNCKHVSITFNVSGNNLYYSIQDDGIGFDKNDQPLGNGLSNIIFRAGKLEAKYDIDTSVDNGMKFNLSFNM